VYSVREDFPILERMISRKDGRPPLNLAYLDNAATTQKPHSVLEALSNYYSNHNANVHRAFHTLGEEATVLYEEARARVRDFIGARSNSEIVFTRGTTESLNLVAGSWGRGLLKRGDEVLLTEMEHHSNLIPWQLLAEEKGIRLRFIPFDEQGRLTLDLLQVWLERATWNDLPFKFEAGTPNVNGCAISTASASMMTELMAGKTLDEVKQESLSFIRVMRGEDASEQLDQSMGGYGKPQRGDQVSCAGQVCDPGLARSSGGCRDLGSVVGVCELHPSTCSYQRLIKFGKGEGYFLLHG